jgi:hypothetical protein
MPRARKDPDATAEAAAGGTGNDAATNADDAATNADDAATNADDAATNADDAATATQGAVVAETLVTAAADAPVTTGPTPRPTRSTRTARQPEPSQARPDKDAVADGGPSITETEPGHIQMVQASTADIRANTVEAHQSAAARVNAASVSLSQGASGLVRGGEVRIEQAAVGALAADHVEFRDGFALLVLARRVSGQVTVLLDWRGLAAVAAVLLVLGRLLRGRS